MLYFLIFNYWMAKIQCCIANHNNIKVHNMSSFFYIIKIKRVDTFPIKVPAFVFWFNKHDYKTNKYIIDWNLISNTFLFIPTNDISTQKLNNTKNKYLSEDNFSIVQLQRDSAMDDNIEFYFILCKTIICFYSNFHFIFIYLFIYI